MRRGAGGAFGEEPQPFDSSDADSVPDDGWQVTGEIGNGNTGNLTIYAICDD